MSDQISALHKQISALRGQRRELVAYLQQHGTLADKARLIHQGVWKCPTVDKDGIVLNPGWEGINYRSSRAVFMAADGVEIWRDIESADPQDIHRAIALWGLEAVCAEFQHYSFEGAYQG